LKPYTKEEEATIKRLMKTTKDKVMHRKYLVIHLHMRGYQNKEIAPIVDMNVQTVGIYINTYKDSGIEGLVPKKQNGRPCFLSQKQEQELHETISKKTPNDVSFDGVMNWTAKIACKWVLEKYNVEYSISGMLKMFHRLDLSYTRPTYVLAKADPEKQEQFIKEFEDVKKTLERRSRAYLVRGRVGDS